MERWAIISDIDGSIHNKVVYPPIIECLNEARLQGHIVILASGRRLNNLEDIPEEILEVANGLVLANGSIIKTKNDTIFEYIDNDMSNIVKSFLDNLNINYYVDTATGMYSRFLRRSAFDWSTLREERVLSFRVMPDTIEKCANIISLINGLGLQTLTWQMKNTDRMYIEILPNNVNKWTSSKKLLGLLNVVNYKTLSIGDDLNDISMLINSDLSVGVGSLELLKFVTDVRADNLEELTRGLRALMVKWGGIIEQLEKR